MFLLTLIILSATAISFFLNIQSNNFLESKKELNIFIPQLSEKNLEITLKNENNIQYNVVDTIRHKIVFGEPVLWTAQITEGVVNYELNYTTPQIDLHIGEKIEEPYWFKNITISTNFSEGYKNINVITDLRSSEDSILISPLVDYSFYLPNLINLTFPELKRQSSVVIRGTIFFNETIDAINNTLNETFNETFIYINQTINHTINSTINNTLNVTLNLMFNQTLNITLNVTTNITNFTNFTNIINITNITNILTVLTNLGGFTLETEKGNLSWFNVDENINIDFKIMDIENGSNVSVDITLPVEIPNGVYFYLWKKVNGRKFKVPYIISPERNKITILLKDGEIDEDGEINGEIIDPLQISLPEYNVNIIKQNNHSSKIKINEKEFSIKSSHGAFDSISIVDPDNLPDVPKGIGKFPYKLVKFNLINVTNQADIYLDYGHLHQNTKLWKFNSNTPEWYEFPFEVVNETTIKITIVDGGFGDDDGIVNGIIEDDLGITNNWWDESWDYRQQINITNQQSQNITDYQIELGLTNSNVGVNFNWTKDNESIRFTQYNFSGDSEIKLAYFIDAWDSSAQTGTVIVKLNNIPADNYDDGLGNGKSIVFMYYNNPDVSSESNGTATYMVFDDFSKDTLASYWSTTDQDGVAGTAFNINNGILNLTAGGSDTWTSADQYGSVYKSVRGDFDVRLKVTSQENSNAWAKSGIMIKNDMIASASSTGYVFMAITPGNGYTWQRDENDNGYLESSTQSGSSAYPAYVRIIKNGTDLSSYYSSNGNSWNLVSTREISSVNINPDVGMSVTSHAGTTLSEVHFDDFSVKQYLNPAPVVSIGEAEYGGLINVTFLKPENDDTQIRLTIFTMNASINCSRGDCGNVSVFYQYTSTATPTINFIDDESSEFLTYNLLENISISGDSLILGLQNNAEPWWDDEWYYRRKLGINNPNGNLVNYTLSIVIDNSTMNQSSFNWSKDNSSLRFISFDNTTQESQELGYYIENWNVSSENGTVLVKISSLAESTVTDLFIYYGNSEANSNSNFIDAYLYADKFNGNSLSSGWSTVDSDNHAATSFDVSGGYLNITAAGADTWTTSDDFGGVYREDISGDVDVIVKIDYEENINSWSKSGIMIRNDMSQPGSSIGYAAMVSRPTSGYSFQRDSDNNGFLDASNGGGSSTFPGYVRLIKNDTSFASYYSSDGNSWTQLGSWVAMSSALTTRDIGLYFTSHNSGTAGTTSFDWIKIMTYADDPVTYSSSSAEEKVLFNKMGNYISESIDTGSSLTKFQNISWNAKINENTSINVYTRTSNDSISWSSWFTENNNSKIQSINNRYIQYKTSLDTSNTNQTPVLNEMKVVYVVSMDNWANMESSNTFFTTTNPYNCGVMDSSNDVCISTRQITPIKRGNYSVRFWVNSTISEIQKTSEFKNVSVFMQPTFSSFIKSKNLVAREGEIDLTALLLDDTSSPLKDYNVSFYDETGNGTRYYIGSTLTNSNGHATISYTLLNDSNLGLHTLNATYDGSGSNFIRGTDVTTTLIISSNPVITDIDVSPEKIGFGYNITITANITDVVGLDKIKIKIINESLDLQTYDMVHVNGNIYQYFFNDSWNVQNYNFQIFANNSDGINTTSITDTFAVEVYASVIIETNKIDYKNNEMVYLDDASNSFYQGWQYRMPIEINSTLNFSNYTFKVMLDSNNFDFTKPQSEGADIRFSYYNFTSSSEQIIPYWIETWDPGIEEAIIWTKVPLIMTSSSNRIYMYYGNTTANSDENPNSLFEFFDDFEGTTYNTSIWTSTSPGNMQVSGGRLRINAGCLYTDNQIVQSDNIIFESKMRWYSGTGNGYAGMMTVDVQDMAGSNGGADANVLYMTNSGGSSTINYYMGDGTTTGYNLGSGSTGFNRVSDTDYVLGIAFNGTNNILFKNYGLQIIEGTFNESVYFYLGYFTGSNAGGTDIQDMNVSWVRARKFINLDDEPTSSLGIEEPLEKGIQNTGTTDMNGYLRMLTQRWTGSAWQNIVPPVIEDDIHTIISKSYLDLASEWFSEGAWNTTNRDPGLYRVYVIFEDANHNTLITTAGKLLEGVYNFTIVESVMQLINLTHENKHEYSLLEYETLDNIAWINATVKAINNIAYDANITLSLLDQSSNFVGWGPINETKDCGDLAENQICEKKWDNSSNGYIIPLDASSGSYNFFWDVKANSDNGQEQTNKSISFKVYNIPSTVSSDLEDIRIEKPNSTTYNFTFTNLWTKNLTNVVVEINCPDIEGFNCSSISSGTEIENIGNLMNGTSVTINYVILANESVPSDNYNISVNVNYTNPGQENKFWKEIGIEILEVRLAGILQITDYSHPIEITRNYDYFDLKAYMNNSADDVASDVWLNYTLPSGWANSSGSLNQYYSIMSPSEIKWNNITVYAGMTSSLGLVNVRLDSLASDGRADFKIYSITTYANTTLSLSKSNYIVNRGGDVTLNAILKYDNGSVLKGKNISIYDQTADLFLGSELTNNTGHVEFDYYINSTSSLGIHTINASYNGSSILYLRGVKNITSIDIHELPQITDVVVSPNITGYGQNVWINATISDTDNIDIAWVEIQYPNGTSLNYTMDITPPTSYYYNFNNTWQRGLYHVIITANDTTNAIQISSQYNFTISSSLLLTMQTQNDSYSQNTYVNLSSSNSSSSNKWWDDSWDFSKLINITNIGKNLTNYQLRVVVETGTLYSDSKIQNDCDDIRFVSYNQSSSGFNQLNYWIEDSCNVSAGGNTTYWVNIPVLETTSTIIDMYYGNSGVENAESTPEEIFEFFDDFEGTTYNSSVWTSTSPGNMQVSGGSLRINAGCLYTDNQIAQSDNIIFESKMRWYEGTGSGYAGMMTVDVQDMQGSNSGADANVLYMTGSGGSSTIYYYMGDGTTTGYNLGSGSTGFNRVSDTDYVLGIGFNGTSNLLFRDYNHVLDSGTFNESVYFYLGAFTGSGSGSTDIQDMNVSWVRARKFVYPEPSYTYNSENIKGSKIFNNGLTDNSGYLLMKVQKNNSGVWQDVDVIINDVNSGIKRNINVSGFGVDTIWNAISWFTATNDAGDYRAYAELQDPDGTTLSSDDGSDINGYWIFNITEPELNLNITDINIYEVTGASEGNWHIYTNDFIDSGINKSFTLDANHIYRIEVDVENIGSSNWTINQTNINYYDLDSSWNINSVEHVWYSNESTISLRRSDISKQGGSFNGTFIWNNSFNGQVEPSNTATFFLIVNVSISERRQINFNIKHATFEKDDYSELNIIVSDSNPPVIVNTNYNLTETNILRGETIGIYGQWDETITEANATYNTVTMSTYAILTNNSPQNSGNWTNFTIPSYSTWYLGEHSAKLIAKDQSNNINNTLSYLNFSVWGLAQISDITLNKTVINVSETIKLSCKIVDDTDSDSPIQNYNVTFYNSSGVIGTALTNSTGWASIDYTDNSLGSEYLNCSIVQDNDNYYKIDSANKSNILLSTLETNPPYYGTINGPSVAHKGDTVNLEVYWQDDFALDVARLSTNASGSFLNISNEDISGTGDWANFSYQIPVSMTPGTLGWRQYANDTSANINQTPIQNIDVWGYSQISVHSLNPENVQEMNYTTMSCKIVDANDSTVLQNYNVSFWYKNSTEFNYNYLGSNFTQTNGVANYTFNLSIADIYSIKCNITDDLSQNYNDSTPNFAIKTLNVASGSDTTPPQILGDNYTINVSSIYRGECFKVSGLWDESINFSFVQYNKTSLDLVQVNISTPYTKNWTNVSICTNETWATGNYSVKLFARDQSGNTNNNLEYKFVLVKARAKVYWVSPAGNINRSNLNLTCQVRDYDTNESIDNYPVTFYDGDLGYSIGEDNTNSSGYSQISHDYSTHSVGQDTLSCVISEYMGYEVVDAGLTEEIVYFYGLLNVNITDPISDKVFHRGDNENLVVNVVDENSVIVTPNTYWYNSTNFQIATGKLTSWNVPNSYGLGPKIIEVNVSKEYYYSDNDSVNVNLWGYSKIELITPFSSMYKNNVLINITCKVSDDDSLGAIQSYPVEFFEGANSLGFDSSNSTGHAVKQINTNILSEGSNALKCVIYDNSTLMYNISVSDEDSVQVNVDKTIPGINYNLNTDDSGVYSKDWIFVNVSISEINVDSVLLYWNGVPENFVNNEGANYWSNKTSLSNNNYSFYAYINDTAGNENQTGQRNITLDTLYPVVTIASPEDKSYNDTTLDLDYGVDELYLDSCWYSLDSGADQALPNCQNTTLSGLSENPHNIIVYANDTAGNIGNLSRNFRVDLTYPLVSIDFPLNDTKYIKNVLDFNYTMSDDINISSCWYSLDSGADQALPNCQNTTLSGLSNANHTLFLYVNDTAGNINSSDIIFEVDYNVFVATSLYPENNSKIASQTISVNVTTNLVASGCNYSLDSEGWVVMSNYSTLNWNSTIIELSEAFHNMTFICTNGINTSQTTLIYFTIDVTGPVITFRTPTPGDGAGIDRDYVYINVSLNEAGKDVILEWQNSSGKYNYTMNEISNISFWYNITNLDDATYNYTVYVKDLLDNPSNSSKRSVIVSTAVPIITIHNPINSVEYNTSVVDLEVSASTQIYSWILELNGENFSFEPNITIAIKQGQNNLTVYGTNQVGQIGNSSISFTFNNTIWHDTFGSYTGLENSENLMTGNNASINFCWPGLYEQGLPQDELNNCWNYRKQINVSSSSTLSNYQVMLTVNLSGEVSEGKAQSDCSDIRFTYTNPSGQDSEINYWIEECNALDKALIWVKVPTINSSTKLHVYYGNNLSEDNSNGDNVFELYDDFSNLSTTEWGTNANNWNSSDGISYADETGASSKITSSYSFTNSYATELKMKGKSSSGSSGYYSIGNSAGNKYLRLYLDPPNDRINLYNDVNNYYSVNSSDYIKYTLISDFGNNNYTLYTDNNVSSAINLNSAASGSNTKPVFYSYYVKGLYLDYLAVRKYSSNHPTVSSAGIEENAVVNASLQSILLTKGNGKVWGNFTGDVNFMSGTNVTFRLLNISNHSVCGDLKYVNISSGYDICSAADSFDSLYMYAELINGGQKKTPSLLNWSIDWVDSTTTTDLIISTITFSTNNPIESQNIAIYVNVTNNGTLASGEFTVQLNNSFYNGTKYFQGSQNSSYHSLSAGQSKQINFTWIVTIGTQIFDAYVDNQGNVTELNETNNQLTENMTTSAWEIIYGNFSYNLILGNFNNDSYMNWTNSVPIGNSYFSDIDASYFPSDLKPLNGTNDLEEADVVLGIGGFNDSIINLFDKNGDSNADDTRTIKIGITNIENIPVINSTDSSTFITGLLYDSADGVGYDGSQDLVIITQINASQQGKYGIYDYEVRVPSKLEELKFGSNIVERLDELI